MPRPRKRGGITWLYAGLEVGFTNVLDQAFSPATVDVLRREDVTHAGAGTYFNISKAKLSLEARYELGLDLQSHKAINRINNALDSDTRTISVLVGLYF